MNSVLPNDNSQTMALLQANISPASVLGPAKPVKVPGIDVSTIVNIADNALVPNATPVAGSDKAIGGSAYEQVSVYVVRPGDSISQIAEMFEVSVHTILAANDLKKSDKIKPGDVLIILPISGVEHVVTKGQTLESIAKLYKVDVKDITSYNDLADNAKLTVGDKILVPGGELYGDPGLSSSPAPVKNSSYPASSTLKSVSGYFINPVPAGRKTQGLHGPGRRGIDIGAPTGTPIYASASGTVLIAKTGWSGGYGNMVIIQHPNGTRTLYAHLSRLGTSTGASVAQGEIIGYVGSTGRSTGPHLHFEVFNAKNPGADWSWASR